MSPNAEVGKNTQALISSPGSSKSTQYTCPQCPHPTKATTREVCRRFQQLRCLQGSQCRYLHVHTRDPNKPSGSGTPTAVAKPDAIPKSPQSNDVPTPPPNECPTLTKSDADVPSPAQNEATPTLVTPSTSTPSQNAPAEPHPLPKKPSTLPGDYPIYTCGTCPHPTRASIQEVCRLFQQRRCYMRERCSRIHIHTRPPFPGALPKANSLQESEDSRAKEAAEDSSSEQNAKQPAQSSCASEQAGFCLESLVGKCQRQECKLKHLTSESSSGPSTPTLGTRTPTLSTTGGVTKAQDGIKVVDSHLNVAYTVKMPNTSPTHLPTELLSAESMEVPNWSSSTPLLKSTAHHSLPTEDDSMLSDFSSSSSSSNYSTANSQHGTSAANDDDVHSALSEIEDHLEESLDPSKSLPPTETEPSPLEHDDSANVAGGYQPRGSLPSHVCRRHAFYQTCPYGRSCQYLHIDPSRLEALQKRSLMIREKLATQPCTSYLRGRCILGDRCSRPHVNSGNPTVLLPNYPCNRWMMGKCDRGEDCDYDHERATFRPHSFTTHHIHELGYHENQCKDAPAQHRIPGKDEGYTNPGTLSTTLQSGTPTLLPPHRRGTKLNQLNYHGYNHTVPYSGGGHVNGAKISPSPHMQKPLVPNIPPPPNPAPRFLATTQAPHPFAELTSQSSRQPEPKHAPPPPRPPGLPPVPTHKHPVSTPRPQSAHSNSPHPSQTHWTLNIDTHTKVRFSAGFNVESVVTGFESCTIVLENVPDSLNIDNLRTLSERYGEVVSINRAGVCLVKFIEPSAAAKAVAGLNGSRMDNNTIVARIDCEHNSLGYKTRVRDNVVRIDWDAPQRTAYAGFTSLQMAQAAISTLNNAEIGGMVISASMHNGLPAVCQHNVRLDHLPINIGDKDLHRLLGKRRSPKETVWGSPNYESLHGAKQYIRSLLEQSGGLVEFEHQSPILNGNVRSWATFTTSASAESAANFIHGRRPLSMNKSRLFALRLISIEYTLKPDLFDDAAKDIDILRKQAWLDNRRHATIHVPPPKLGEDGQPSPKRLVRISAPEKQDLLKLKADFEIAIYGEVLRDEEGRIVWESFFRYPAGTAFCLELQKQHPGVRITVQFSRHTIRIFGPSDKRATVRRTLLERATEFRSCMTHHIPISGQVIGIFMQHELPELVRLLGPENVTLLLLDSYVVVRGNLEAHDAVLAAIRRCEQEHSEFKIPIEQQCTVCFDQVTRPMHLPCGHRYCRTCLESYLTSSIDNKSFPLRCLGDEAKCRELIPLSIARAILEPSQFESITDAAFQVYIHTRPQEFHHCPTPDCEQVYRSGPENTYIQCPSCTARICPACHVEYHEGVRCEDYDEVGDKAFMSWAKAHGVKTCPGCGVPIEKADGCNHMTCTRCQTHVCWVCMETFPKGEGIYAHMRVKHGGFGLEDPF